MWDCPLDIPYEQIPPDYIITTDRNLYDKADVVVFHMPTLYHELSGDLNKHTNQKWVAWYLESEANYPFLKDQKIMSLFDYHMSYRQKAEIIYPYYQYDHIDIFHKEKRALKKKGYDGIKSIQQKPQVRIYSGANEIHKNRFLW